MARGMLRWDLVRSPIHISVLVLLSLSLAGGTAADAARSKSRGGDKEKKISRRGASAKRAPGKTDGSLPRGAGQKSAIVHKQKLRGGERVMAEIATSPGLPAAPVADSFIRGKLFFGDPARSFKGSRAQRAILRLAKRAGGSHAGTFALTDPGSGKLVGYYSQISTGASSGLHVFHDPMGRKVATTPFTY